MASKKRSVPPKPAGFGAKNWAVELAQAATLIGRKKWAEAMKILEDLNRSHPKNPDILTLLGQVYYELQHLSKYQQICEQLLELDPNDAEITLNLASVYLSNLHPFLALQTFRHFIEQWPDHAYVAETRKLVANLEEKLVPLQAEMQLTGDDGLELAILHERGQAYLEGGEYEQARLIEQELLSRRPDFVPGWNNLSLVFFMEGNASDAIATAQKALEIDPENIHALSNLTRFFYLNGQVEAAKDCAERLKNSSVTGSELWVKKVEALSFLADYQGILDLFEQATASREAASVMNPLFNHLVAVAMMRLGKTKDARKQWQEALKKSPEFSLAKNNLDDLKRPVGERHGPWSFEMGSWLTRTMLDDLIAMTKTASREDGKFQQATQRYLQEHPELLHLVPMLLDRGDPQGREFAVRVAEFTATPDMLEALRDFALSDRGPDSLRNQAAIKASEAGLLSREKTRMWIQGEWREIMLISYEFHDDLLYAHSAKVKKLLAQAIPLMKEEDLQALEQAEQLFRQAIALEPNAPDLLNNLAATYELRDRMDDANALLQEIIDRFPDYVFARVGIASQLIDRGELEAAEEILKPLISRKRFHFGEFAAFANMNIELLVAQKNRDGARGWLNMWERIDPESPAVKDWKRRLRPAKFLSK